MPEWAAWPAPSGNTTAHPESIVVRFVSTDPSWNPVRGAHPVNVSGAWSAWPHHPAILPPLPRQAKSDALVPAAPTRAVDVARAHAAARRTHGTQGSRPRETTVARIREVPRPARTTTRTPRRVERLAARHAPPDLAWPADFDDWMMDIVRRRALRLNSGARRRGVRGSVRAVELAHILARSADENGSWRCAICHEPVTLADLSFDHVVALADGGEHAAYNLVPAHRKCNEIKGSEKAQFRASALDRWLDEWAGAGAEAPRDTNRQPTLTLHPREQERRYA